MATLAASLVPPYSWNPEDELLLKNAVEAGASLEALAKRAVQSPRKFTVGELRDCFHSLLYDPDVSAQASAGMVQFELSVTVLSKMRGSKEGDDVSAKRKVESVRRLYNAIRKKTRVQSHKASVHGSIGTTYANGCIGIGSFWREIVAFEGKAMCGSCTFGGHDQDPFAFASTEHFYELPVGVPQLEDRGHGEEKVFVTRGLNVNMICSTEMNAAESGAMLQDKGNVDGLTSSSAFSECAFVDLPESLLFFPNEDGLSFMDTDRKDLVDKSSDEDHSLLLASAPNDSYNDAADDKEPPTFVCNTSLRILGGKHPAYLEINKESQSGDRAMNSPQSMSAMNTWLLERKDGEMECSLNTEDPEIPYNDSMPTATEFAASVKMTTSKEAGYLSSVCANQKDEKKQLVLMNREDNPAKSHVISPMVGLDMLSLRTLRPAISTHKRHSQCRSAMPTLALVTGGVSKVESLCVYNATDIPLPTKSSFPEKTISVPEKDNSTQNEEGSECDEDVPCFSDIEAMVLEMDLCRDDPDSSINREVLCYQSEDAKRAIMRLEQCARSSMQRAIASRGALAILYGRHLKHYLKETEVMLGRATDDIDVDIDLGREGPANKISRRQALIKMESDGSFHLKNLGKSPIFLNGKEVATGQSTRLTSSSLIEIRGMSFVFEVSSKSVRHYLTKVAKNLRETTSKFEWSDEVFP